MNEAVKSFLTELYGQPCCLQYVGERGRLMLGFESVIEGETPPHGRWEIGTYYCA